MRNFIYSRENDCYYNPDLFRRIRVRQTSDTFDVVGEYMNNEDKPDVIFFSYENKEDAIYCMHRIIKDMKNA